ncbi:unnamed protein product [Dovyalis caffra]|uniref:Uncharacterized protein n=1 Tax=Dovyalis caffra TaxID=77055 RepID=A0AAV1SBV5_9ROSI|nr:unnamed protein product [Dovyalis caffra]
MVKLDLKTSVTTTGEVVRCCVHPFFNNGQILVDVAVGLNPYSVFVVACKSTSVLVWIVEMKERNTNSTLRRVLVDCAAQIAIQGERRVFNFLSKSNGNSPTQFGALISHGKVAAPELKIHAIFMILWLSSVEFGLLGAKKEENLSHLFIHCPVAVEFWAVITTSVGICYGFDGDHVKPVDMDTSELSQELDEEDDDDVVEDATKEVEDEEADEEGEVEVEVEQTESQDEDRMGKAKEAEAISLFK